jgi:hypothetical protein
MGQGMTMVTRSVLVVPELGPALGRLVAPAGAHGPTWVPVDDLRIALVTELFSLAGDARRWAREGDRELALATLSRSAFEEAWHRTVDTVAARVAEQVNARLVAAAREARLPAKRAKRLPLEPSEVRAIAARLAQGDGGFREALAMVEVGTALARSERAPVAGVLAWQEALLTSARRLEAAWLALLEALAREGRDWDQEVEDLRRWRRPAWPLWAVGVTLFAGALYVGLVLGGYLPVPEPLRPLAEELWARWN